MKINSIQSVIPFSGTQKLSNNKKSNVISNQTAPFQKATAPSSELLRVMSGVQTARPEPPKYTKKTAEIFLDNHPADKILRGSDRFNIRRVMMQNDEQASNIQMQLDLVADGDLEPSTLRNYWATGKMNDNLAKDIDMVWEAKQQNKNVNDIYVPTVTSKADGHKKVAVGDVFKVENEDKIYVKANDDESRQLNMDKEMFVKLFPPAKRFTTQQQSIGDCYLVSTLGTLMNHPKARVALYEAFNQDGKDVSVKFKNGFGEYKYENAELPIGRELKYSIAGSTGIKLLEDAYGLDSVNKADTMFKKIMTDKIAKKTEESKTAPLNKKAEILKSLEGHKKRLNNYLEATADKSRKIVVCRDDNYFNLFYEEDEYGLKFADLKKDPDNASDKFRSPADFYRGALGGYNFEVLNRFGFGGFRQLNLNFEAEKVRDLMMKKDFNKDYIMTGGTRANEGRVENPVAEAAGIFGFHAYTLEPQMTEGKPLTVRCTNPWNTSYDADISFREFLTYYDSVSVVDVNSYGKDLPLEEQPVKYGKKGVMLGNNINDVEVTWFTKK